VFSASLPRLRPAGQDVLDTFGPGMVPPRRVSGNPPAYPEAARIAGLEGTSVADVWIDEGGGVGGASVRQSAGELLDRALLEAVAGWRFVPATLEGRPVAVRFVVRHAFRR
jgi:protein TonB